MQKNLTSIIVLCLIIAGIVAIYTVPSETVGLYEANAEPAISGRYIYAGLGAPVDMDFTGIPGDERIFVTEKRGSIRITGVSYGTPFFDISEKVESPGEKGMLGMTFDPDFANNGYFYVFYTGPFDNTQDPPTFKSHIERYTVSDNPNFADLDSGFTILEIVQKSEYHNGGNLTFGPDGYLYIGVGEDNERLTAQDLNSLNGKVLRIDVNADRGLPADCDQSTGNYSIPADNPFVGQAGCNEVWAYGLRNPWRFNFDSVTSDMYLGDVGESRSEEINFQPASSMGGENYGWPYFEGAECSGGIFQATCDGFTGHVPPIIEYPHSSGGGSVTGGFVYRGSMFPNLYGHYVYGDFTNSVLSTAFFDGGSWQVTDHGPMITEGAPLISSFGQDPDGELYAVRFTDGNPEPGKSTGYLYRIVDEYGFDIKLEAPESVSAGSEIEYKLTVTNVGSQPISNVQIENEIPAGVSYLSGGSRSGSTVSWQIGTLAVEETAVVSWVANSPQTSVLNDSYRVSADGQPPVVGRQPVITELDINLGGRVFDDINQNGIDDEEPGIGNVELKLWRDRNCDGAIESGDLIETKNSESDGSYQFSSNGLDFSICYLIKINLDDIPDRYESTALNVGENDEIDSDFYSVGWTDSFRLPTSPVNAGFFDPSIVPIPPTETPEPATATPTLVPTEVPDIDVFGRVFQDQNGNGVDDGEPGLSGIEVSLWRDNNCDGNVSAGNLIGREFTLISGSYRFIVENSSDCFLIKVNVDALPAGWVVTERNVGTNDAIDSDIYPFGWTDKFTLPVQPINAGVYDSAQVTPVPSVTPDPPNIEPTKEFEFPPTSTPIPPTPIVVGPDWPRTFFPVVNR